MRPCLLALCLASTPLAGCERGPSRAQAALPSPAAASSAPEVATPESTAAPAICDAGDTLPTAAAIAALGPPSQETRFALSEPLGEFRIKLLNHFTLPRDAATEIRERTWAQRDCRLTIWSAQRAGGWQPVEQLAWSQGDEF